MIAQAYLGEFSPVARLGKTIKQYPLQIEKIVERDNGHGPSDHSCFHKKSLMNV